MNNKLCNAACLLGSVHGKAGMHCHAEACKDAQHVVLIRGMGAGQYEKELENIRESHKKSVQVRQKLQLEAVAGSDASWPAGQRPPKQYRVHGHPETEEPGHSALLLLSSVSPSDQGIGGRCSRLLLCALPSPASWTSFRSEECMLCKCVQQQLI